ncbi:MAG: SURF1 family protein [Lysobacterales bacterium]|jgi:cytochrome oxidase assembly protein ShyY1
MRFKPSIKLTVLMFALALIFVRLGYWQLQRKAEKTELFRRFAEAPTMNVEAAMAAGERFARVEAHGHYDPRRHVLLDNRIFQGRAGVHVLTPFYLDDGSLIMVNRGWLPLPADRRSLPDVPTNPGEREIRGRLDGLTSQGPRLGQPDVLNPEQWPQLMTYLDPGVLAGALGRKVPDWQVKLDSDDSSGFGDRDWKPAVMAPAQHGAYAVQWFGFCAAAIAIWIVLGLQRGRSKDSA